MTLVWKTAGGGRYHRYEGCSGITDGQAKAASEGKRTYPAVPMDLVVVEQKVAPCSVCWRDEFRRDRWLPSQLETEAKADSEYEVRFFEDVLKRVQPPLDPDYIRIQHEVHGTSGRNYRVDFAVVRPGHPPIAVEIDGFQKDKRRNEADEARQSSSAARQNDLVNAGWQVLRFTNRQVATESGACRAAIETLLLRTAPMTPSAPRTEKLNRRTPKAAPVAAAPMPPAPREPATVPSGRSEDAKLRGSSPMRWGLGAVAAVALACVIGAVIALSRSDSGVSVDPTADGSCPASAPVKGNEGSMIFHEPGWEYYERTVAEVCFATAEDAASAGYRASEVQ